MPCGQTIKMCVGSFCFQFFLSVSVNLLTFVLNSLLIPKNFVAVRSFFSGRLVSLFSGRLGILCEIILNQLSFLIIYVSLKYKKSVGWRDLIINPSTQSCTGDLSVAAHFCFIKSALPSAFSKPFLRIYSRAF